MDNKTYDPNLRKAMSEIQSVMSKHQVCGYVFLGSMSHYEFRMNPEASWSFLKIESRSEDGSYSMRMRVKGEASKQKTKFVNATLGFLFNLRDNLFQQLQSIHEFCEKLEKQADIEHRPGEIKNDDREIEDLS